MFFLPKSIFTCLVWNLSSSVKNSDGFPFGFTTYIATTLRKKMFFYQNQYLHVWYEIFLLWFRILMTFFSGPLLILQNFTEEEQFYKPKSIFTCLVWNLSPWGWKFWWLSFGDHCLHCNNYTEEERFCTKINIYMFGMKSFFFDKEVWCFGFTTYIAKAIPKKNDFINQNQYLHVWYEIFLLR